ncbi:MAG: lysylphosphatidylglycerol synthase transmembrane domain-containing protein [Chthoniobacteraceae bacterium]
MKRALFTTLQVLITVGALWFVFRDGAKRAEMADAIVDARALWLILGFLFYGMVELSAVVRWQVLLQVQNVHLSWARVLALVMIGVFFNFFIPGGTGGDAVKIFYLLKETPGHRTGALLSVLVDRMIGLFALIVAAGVIIALKWSWLTGNPHTAHWIWITLAVLGASLGFLIMSFVVTGFRLVHKLPARLPGRDKLAELALAYHQYARCWRASLTAFAISIFAHFGYWFTYYCAARSLATPTTVLPRFAEFMSIMPVVSTITSLPISIGGIGWREVIFQTFLSNLSHASEGVAVAISTTGYVLTLAWGLIGGLMYLAYRPSKHARLRDIRSEVKEFEHEVAEREIALETKPDAP